MRVLQKYLFLFCIFTIVFSCAKKEDETKTSDNSSGTISSTPALSEVTQIITPSNNTQPTYTFSSTENGDLNFSGNCSSASSSVVAGNNTITLNPLADGTYTNCKISVTNQYGNQGTLDISEFEIDTTNVLYLNDSEELRCSGDGIFSYSSSQNQISFGNPPEIFDMEDNSSISSGSNIKLSGQKKFNILNGGGVRFYITVSPQTPKIFIQYDGGGDNACLSQ